MIRPYSTVFCFFFFNDTATTEIYTLSLHDALPICRPAGIPSPITCTTPNQTRTPPTPARNAIRLRSDPGELTPWRKGRAGTGGSVNGDAAGGKPHVAGYVGQAARPSPASSGRGWSRIGAPITTRFHSYATFG